MVEYQILIARSAVQEIEALPASIFKRVMGRVESLAGNPRPPGCCKLVGTHNLWRIRVGDYRVVYAVDDRKKIVDISVVRHRKDVYR